MNQAVVGEQERPSLTSHHNDGIYNLNYSTCWKMVCLKHMK